MIFIFDSCGGLCNQILDINCALDFSVKYNLAFTFRHCSFRLDDVNLFNNNIEFGNLFNKKHFTEYKNYIPFEKIKQKIDEKNTINYNNIIINKWCKDDNELFNMIKLIPKNTHKQFIIIKQFFCIYNFTNIKKNFYHIISPCEKIYNICVLIIKKLLPSKFNFIHYRYEEDFTSFFNISNIHSIDYLLDKIHFKNNKLKIYIACSNLKELSNTKYLHKHIDKYKNIIIKDDFLKKYNMHLLNFEQKAFIDYIIGQKSEEIYGYNKSSFSKLLNFTKHTNNYYNDL